MKNGFLFKSLALFFIFSLFVTVGCERGGGSHSGGNGAASLVSIQDADGDEYDPNIDTSTVAFTLTGEFFGESQASVDGVVKFIKTDDKESILADITEWTETEIKGTVDLPAGQYSVQVATRYHVSAEALSFYKAQWFTMDSGTGANLWGVWGSSETHVFAVGMPNTILHYAGEPNGWEQMPIADAGYLGLRSIWGASGTDVFAVGLYGAIVHYDGSEWSRMHYDEGFIHGNADLWAVWGSSGTDVFAVGSAGTIIHYNGISWTRMESGTTTTFFDVWGASGEDVYAVGVDGRIYHYDGISWSSTGPYGPEGLYSIWGLSGNDIFVTGVYVEKHYDGSAWSSIPFYSGGMLYSLWGVAATDMYATSGGTVVRYNGLSWERKAGVSSRLNAIWGNSASDIFAVGDSGTIIHFYKP
jgi:hypothetical protein